jgi:hypothetical protein
LYPALRKPEFGPFTINGRQIASRADAFEGVSELLATFNYRAMAEGTTALKGV